MAHDAPMLPLHLRARRTPRWSLRHLFMAATMAATGLLLRSVALAPQEAVPSPRAPVTPPVIAARRAFRASDPDFQNHPASDLRPIAGMTWDAVPPDAPHGVTVLIAFRDRSKLIGETLESLRRQTLYPTDILIVNDHSSEEEREALGRICAATPRCRVHDARSTGVSTVRNEALDLVRTEFVALLDSDDMLEHTVLEEAAFFLRSNPDFSVVEGWSVGFGAMGYVWYRGFGSIGTDGQDACMAKYNCTTLTSVHRTADLRAVGGLRPTFNGGLEDWDLWLRYLENGNRLHQVPRVYDWYRRSEHKWWTGNAEDLTPKLLAEHEKVTCEGCLDPMPPANVTRQYLPYDPDVFLGLDAARFRVEAPAGRAMIVMPWFAMGGADRVNLETAAALREAGWHVTVVATHGFRYEWLSEYEDITPDVLSLPDFVSKNHFAQFLAYLVRSRGTDVVMISNSEAAYYSAPLVRAEVPGVRWVTLDHMPEAWRWGGHARTTVSMTQFFDLHVGVTDDMRDWLVREGVDPAKTRVCHNGVDPGPDPAMERPRARAALEAQGHVRPGDLVAVYPHRIEAQKRPLETVRAVKRAVQLAGPEAPALRVLVAGGGSMWDAMAAEIKAQGVQDNFVNLGPLSHDRVVRVIRGADVFLQPSDNEGLSVALLEAMAAGTVPIATDVGGQGEALGPDEGWLVEDGPLVTETVARALATALGAPEALAEMSRAARRKVTEGGFTKADFRSCIAGVFEDAQGSKPAKVTDDLRTLRELYVLGTSLL